VDGKRKRARGRRKRAWIITGIIILAYACYAVWDYTAPNRVGDQFYFERKDFSGIMGMRLIYNPEINLGGPYIYKDGIALSPYGISQDNAPEAFYSWEPYHSVLDVKQLPADVRPMYEKARDQSAFYLMSMPFYILRYPHLLHLIDLSRAPVSLSQLSLGRCSLRIKYREQGIARWERYYEGEESNDGFNISTGNSRLWLYVNEERVSARYVNTALDYAFNSERTYELRQIALYAKDGKSIVFAKDESEARELWDELQVSLRDYWDLFKLKGVEGVAPDNQAWSRLEQGLNDLKVKPAETRISDEVNSLWKLLVNGPYEERNLELALDGRELAGEKYTDGETVVIERLTQTHLIKDKEYMVGDLRIHNSKWDDARVAFTQGKNDYNMYLGNPTYFTKVDETGHTWGEDGVLSLAWFVNLEKSCPVLSALLEKDEVEYGGLLSLAESIAEKQKDLGEFGANPVVKQVVRDLQDRRVSFRKVEKGTKSDWTGTVCGNKVQWELDWVTNGSTHRFQVFLGSKDFVLDWRCGARISPSPNGYILIHNGPYPPLTDADKVSLKALIQAERLGFVKIPYEVKVSWDKFVQFVENGLMTVEETRQEDYRSRNYYRELINVLN
jgi:hypothetical protein